MQSNNIIECLERLRIDTPGYFPNNYQIIMKNFHNNNTHSEEEISNKINKK